VHLKPLSTDAIPSALSKAERYRLLNEPGQAESICLDVLDVDPDNQDALVMLVLALTDQFGGHDPRALQRARDVVGQLNSPYARAYYNGLVCERQARARLGRHGHGSADAAREWLKDALEHFEAAEPIRPVGNDDAILRWNACVRMLQRLPETGEDAAQTSIMMSE